MKSKNSYGLIHIGLCIRLLLNISKDDLVRLARVHIEKLEKELKEASFEVSIAGGDEIRGIAIKLKQLEDNEKVGDKISKQLIMAMSPFERIVYAESLTKNIYVLPSRRFNTEFLLNSPSSLFKNGTFKKLSEMAQFDIKSSCRCVLFGEGTAAAFHILRATEETLKQYYFHHKRQKRLKKPMWGPMTIELRAKKTNKPPEVLLSSLDIVRNSYRNPTQHPNTIYDIESAQDLLGVCIDLIGKMAI